jgi:hypothetical protein
MPTLSLSRSITATLNITVADFNLHWSALLVPSESKIEAERAILKFALDESVSLILRLTGKLIDNPDSFQPEQGRIETTIENACDVRGQFVGSTLMAAFGLAKEIRFEIAELGLSLQQNFDLPLSLISDLLSVRQTTFGLMVIEKSVGNKFTLPTNFTDDDRLAIALAQRAIVQRSFTRNLARFAISVAADKELLGLPDQIKPSRFKFPTDSEDIPILDQTISLGPGQITIDEAVIENLDEVRYESSVQENGHKIPVSLRSLTGEIHFDFPEAPHLNQAPWDDKIKVLVDLEDQLGMAFADRLNSIAANTLSDLTEEEKAAVTERTEVEMQ